MTATSMHRISEQTPEHVNREISQKTQMHILYYRQHPERIDQRLRELEEEWDIERMLQLGSSTLSLLGLVMSLRRPRWLLLPMLVQGFFMQHAIQGWCPPVSILRRLGFRTQAEIAEEYHALKRLAGQEDEDEIATSPGE